ncbi:3'-5' exonuclease [Clostridium sp. DL1XJH146]
MNYIIFDLEYNQDFRSKKEKSITEPYKICFEIIQIGAIKLDEDFKTISNFNRLIKPEIYPELHPFIKKLTGITANQLSTAPSFNQAYEAFIQFIGDKESVLCVWGLSDIKELYRNVKYHKLDTELLSKKYINIQSPASKYLNCPKGTSIGLSNAVELLNISIKENFHDAFNDAYYTGEVFKKMSNIPNINIKIKTYDHNNTLKRSRQGNKKTTVDTYSLIKQFEKMYNREITDEEKSIIKLAYTMGKTGQFTIEEKPTTNKPLN